MNIYVTGYPRSGTTWLSRLLSCALDSPLTNLTGKPVVMDFCRTGGGGYRIVKTHWQAHEWNSEGKVVFIQRDPRDVAVSAAHYLNIPLWDILRNMCVWSQSPFDKTRHIFHVQGDYENFVTSWLNDEKSIYTCYDWLKSGPCELYDILKQLELRLEYRKAVDAWRAMSFDNLKEKHPHSMRKGIVGDWKNHFDKKHGEMITKYLGSLMLQQSYIQNLDWWRELK